MNFISILLNSLPGAVSQGLIWGVMAIGVYITFRVLDIADLTVDGSFATGGAVCIMLIKNGHSPAFAMLIALLSGMIAGMVTGLLHTKCGIPAILAGILTQLALFSVNLRIMGNQALQSVSADKTPLFLSLRNVRELNFTNPIFKIVIVIAAIIAVLYWFFGTEIGCSMRAVGANKNMARAQGINTDFGTVFALMLSNGLVGLSGAIVSQYQGFSEVNMGRGAIVIGLAAVIIGEVAFGKIFKNFALKLFSVAIGAVIYYIVLQIVLTLGLNTNDLKLLSAAIVAVFLSVPHFKNKFMSLKHTNREARHVRN